MRCPSCSQMIHGEAVDCPHCSLSMKSVDDLFDKRNRVVCEGVYDEAGVFTVLQRKSLEKLSKELQKKIPQVQVTTVTVSLSSEESARLYGFWLLNRGVYSDCGEAGVGRILIVIDVEKKEVCMSSGYLFDRVTNEYDLFNCLEKAYPHFLRSRYVQAVKVIIRSLKSYLAKSPQKVGRRR